MEPALSNCLIPMAFDRPEIEPFSIYAINDAVGVRITSRSRHDQGQEKICRRSQRKGVFGVKLGNTKHLSLYDSSVSQRVRDRTWKKTGMFGETIF